MNFFCIIGAMKSGTSSLHHHLATHPALCAAREKEPSFFTEAAPSARQVAAYRALFPTTAHTVWCFEASTNYAKSPRFAHVPERLYAMFPEARLVYVLRHPVERIYSHYLHNVGRGREQRPFEEAVFGQDTHYLDVSRYYMQLTAYLEYFPPERILLLLFEDFVHHKLATVQRVLTFLDVDAAFVPPNLHEKKNVTAQKTVARPLLQTLRGQSWYPRLPRPIRAACVRLLQQPAPRRESFDDPVLNRRILECLAEDMHRLQAYLGTPLTAWKS